jgi:hypothetical protein
VFIDHRRRFLYVFYILLHTVHITPFSGDVLGTWIACVRMCGCVVIGDIVICCVLSRCGVGVNDSLHISLIRYAKLFPFVIISNIILRILKCHLFISYYYTFDFVCFSVVT